MIDSPWKRALLVLGGLAIVALGVAGALRLDGENRVLSVMAILPAGIAAIVAGLLRPTSEGSTRGARNGTRRVAGRRRSGTLVPIPRRRTVGVVVVFLALTSIGMSLALYPRAFDGHQAIVRTFGIVMALGCGALGVAEARGLFRGGFGLLLSPDGLGSGPTWIPWDAVTGVSVVSFGEADLIGVSVVNLSLVETSAVASHFSPMNRRHGADLMLPLDPLDVDGDLLMAALERLVVRPEDRPLLLDPGGAEALRRLVAPAA